MTLEIAGRRLHKPPLRGQDPRNSEVMKAAEVRTEAPLIEYIEVREGHMQRVIFEVLRTSGLPFEISESLAKLILDIHKEKWDKGEDPATRTAIGKMSVPTTPLREDTSPFRKAIDKLEDLVEGLERINPGETPTSLEAVERGDVHSSEVLEAMLQGKLPELHGLSAPQK